MKLTEVTWTDAEAETTDLVLVPTGSTEQHGPHAPLSTDTITAETVAEAGAESYTGDVIITPTIPIGISEEHGHFPGTLWVQPDTFRAYIRDVLLSLIHHGWNRIVLVNGHGGNHDALREIAADITRHEPAYAVTYTWFNTTASPEIGHAGGYETAIINAYAPELIHDDRIDTARTDATDRWGDWVNGVNLAYDTHEFASNGVIGDPSSKTPEDGRKLIEQAGVTLAEILESVADRDLL